MRTNARAPELFPGDDGDVLERLPAFLGFGLPARLDEGTQRLIGVPGELASVRIAPGPGTTRLLLAVAGETRSARDATTRVAASLSRRAPHFLWLVAISIEQCEELVVAAWHAAGIAALVVDRRRPRSSDLDTLGAVRDAMTGPDLLIHQRWIEILGREAITRRFFHTLRDVVDELASGASGPCDPSVKREIAVLHVSRLLFLSFLEARSWLDGDVRFLAREYDACLGPGTGSEPHRFQQRVLEPLFFGTLNTPVRKRAARARAFGSVPFLNGGLFTRSATETRWRAVRMHDEHWGAAFDRLFLRYQFTPREEVRGWQEAAVDPEILGRAFESLMAAGTRRAGGVYYTPFALVARVTGAALRALLVDRGLGEWGDAVASGAPLPADMPGQVGAAIRSARVLDPACGSGAFLVHLVDRLASLQVATGDDRPIGVVRREVVARQVFGVDINPTAVWLCELRLWLSLVVDHPSPDPLSVPPLPNLDHNIRCGDTLAGGAFTPGGRTPADPASRLRIRYARATGTRKRTLSRALERAERRRMVALLDERIAGVAAQRLALVSAARGRDLFGGRRGAIAGEPEALRQLRSKARGLRAQRRAVASGGALPFAFAAYFPDAAARGGFDLVIGNPPWIRLHHLPASQRAQWRREFRVFREAAWLDGARLARAGAGFGSQVDAAMLFVERSHQLLRERGTLSLLVPSKLWRSLAGGGVRRLLAERTRIHLVEDWSSAPAMFDAATYPAVIVAGAAPGTDDLDVRLSVQRGNVDITWGAPSSTLPFDESPGAPWLLLPPAARAAFDRIRRAGVPLGNAGLGVATMGVKCGCNQAFVVRAVAGNDAHVEVTDGTRRARLERGYVRPLLRGEMVRRWAPARSDERLVFPCTTDGRVLADLPLGLRHWLWPWRGRLRARSDARGERAWWSLFRLEAARSDRPRVAWADLGRSLQAIVLPAGDDTVPLNTCYVLATRDDTDALALAALFNSPLADAWVGALAEPARGGYRRHFAWTMARLPVPDDWARAREILAPLGLRGMGGDAPGRSELLDAAVEAFRVRAHSVTPLIEWMNG